MYSCTLSGLRNRAAQQNAATFTANHLHISNQQIALNFEPSARAANKQKAPPLWVRRIMIEYCYRKKRAPVNY